uniref:glutathione transferase n=1 Tax=Acrobeloides nanus TaxID=290746 RepID=A0A914E149_9BILA
MFKYRLCDFYNRGNGEVIRMILHYVGENFDDHRMFQEEWLVYKHNLAGSDDWESAQLDAIADFQKEFADSISTFLAVIEPESCEKEQMYQEIFILTDAYFTKIQEMLKESGFLGSQPTWVDFIMADHIDILHGFIPIFFDKYPAILAYKERVFNLPMIREYVKSRRNGNQRCNVTGRIF